MPNLALIAERLRTNADMFDAAMVDGPTQLSASHFLRERADRFDEVNRQMAQWNPFSLQPTLDSRPARRLLITAAVMGGIAVGLLAYVLLAVGL
jgi:hypothetical protein